MINTQHITSRDEKYHISFIRLLDVITKKNKVNENPWAGYTYLELEKAQFTNELGEREHERNSKGQFMKETWFWQLTLKKKKSKENQRVLKRWGTIFF